MAELIISDMPLGELQTHIEKVICFIQDKTNSLSDRLEARESYREKAEMYNTTFNLLSGKVKGDKGWESIYDINPSF